MIKIDDSLLEEIGLISLPKQDRDQMLRQIYETLEMRVGMRLAERMSDQQLDEFERFIDTNDEAGALKWLETNFPDYKQVVADELEKLKGEIKKDSGRILEAMQAQAQATPIAPAAQQPYAPPAAAAPVQPMSAAPAWPASAPEPIAPAPQQAFAPQPALPQMPPVAPAPQQPSFARPMNPASAQSSFGAAPQPMQQNDPAQSQQPTVQDDPVQQPPTQAGPNIPPPPGF